MSPRTGFQSGSTAWVFLCPGRRLRWLPRNGSSEAALKVFEDLDGGEPANEVNGTVGGTVYPVLYVTIGAGERCTGGSVTLRITDEYCGYWAGTNTKEDISISLSSSSGWQTFNGSSWVDAQFGPSSTDNKEGATPLQYRYVVTAGWETHKKPLGNNGRHSVATTSQIEFEEWVVGDGWTNEYPCGPAATSVTTENVWISSCTASNGTIDYFKYDPDGGEDLAHPRLQFTISDADPHKYCCIIRFRQTIGEGTWNWDSGWWSMRVDLGQNRTADIDLTQPGWDGKCLNEDEHEWGTYTYDLIVIEYAGEEPKWVQSGPDGGIDWNFLKRYREGYYLWVPADLPSPYGDEPGHDVWTETPEDGNAQLRGYYCLESAWSSGQEAQVPRGEDVCIIVVDPDLNERGSKTGPSVPETLGADYGTVDSDQDDLLDGLLLYTFRDSDPAGTWRGIFTAADNGGLRSPEWRSHTPLRMMTANQMASRQYLQTWWTSYTDWAFDATYIPRPHDEWVRNWLWGEHQIPYVVVNEGDTNVQIQILGAKLYAKLSDAQKERAVSHTVIYCDVTQGVSQFESHVEDRMFAGCISHAGTPDRPDVCFIVREAFNEMVEGRPNHEKYRCFVHMYFHELCHAAGLGHCTGDTNCVMNENQPIFPRWSQDWGPNDPWGSHAQEHRKTVIRHLGGRAK